MRMSERTLTCATRFAPVRERSWVALALRQAAKALGRHATWLIVVTDVVD